MLLAAIGEPFGQGWEQLGDLALAMVLCSLIGLEREFRQKSAGVRTHTIVGLGAALIVLVSKYGFTDVLGLHVDVDPSRVAAQIVTGIGFIGGGLIFVRRDSVRGLTTASVVWLTAAVGMAAGASLPVLAVAATVGHFLVVSGYTAIAPRLPNSRYSPSPLSMTYHDGEGVLRRVLAYCTEQGFTVSQVSTDRGEHETGKAKDNDTRGGPRDVTVQLHVQGRGSVTDLAVALSEMNGVVTVTASSVDISTE
jgi:putative Mg2+ transporter-C (MgtC) family protein